MLFLVEELAQKAIGLFPDEPSPYAQIAYAMARLKRAEAPEWALKAISKEPENALWRITLSDTFTLRGKWKEALKPMSEAVAMDPTNPRSQSMLGLILVHCRMPKTALPYLERSLELDPTNALAHQRMSLALYKLHKRKEAENHLRKALELQPDNPDIQNTLGWRLLGRGRWGEAEEAFNEALRLDPRLVAAKVGLGAPASFKKRPADIILRASMRLYSLPYRIVLLPMHAVLAVEITWDLLTIGGSSLFKAIAIPIAIWSWCYTLSIVFIYVIGRRRGAHFV